MSALSLADSSARFCRRWCTVGRGNKVIKTGSWIKRPRSFLKNKRDGWSKGYHVFSVEWTLKRSVFRIDGKLTWRTCKGVCGQPQYPTLRLLASDYELSLTRDKQFPQRMPRPDARAGGSLTGPAHQPVGGGGGVGAPAGGASLA